MSARDKENESSGIIEESLTIELCSSAQATHFVLCRGGKMRYLIEKKSGAKALRRAVAAYSRKLALMLSLMQVLPYRLLSAFGLGYFARVELHSSVSDMMPGGCAWNALIGTYSARQKIVFQCFDSEAKGQDVYVKVGNVHSEKVMHTEINFLTDHPDYRTFSLPTMRGARKRGEESPFNILVTDDIGGAPVPPVLTSEIYALYQEIAAETKEENGQILVRSHGDFAPWNIRCSAEGYIIFDWEFCGWRPRGYDPMHFMTIVGIALKGLDFDAAYEDALNTVRRFEPDFRMDKEAFRREYSTLMQS